jgi:uncharacterized damage-inducible protein DinB
MRLTTTGKRGEMVSLETLCELYDYSFWARGQQLAVCAALSEEQWIRPLGSSFDTLRDTLKHLIGADWVWLERFNGRSPRNVPWINDTQTLEKIQQRWLNIEQDLRAYLATLKLATLNSPLTYQNFKGETWSYPLWKCLVHLLNHETYHRGQVTMALRQLGAIPPPIDFLVYCDSR